MLVHHVEEEFGPQITQMDADREEQRMKDDAYAKCKKDTFMFSTSRRGRAAFKQSPVGRKGFLPRVGARKDSRTNGIRSTLMATHHVEASSARKSRRWTQIRRNKRMKENHCPKDSSTEIPSARKTHLRRSA